MRQPSLVVAPVQVCHRQLHLNVFCHGLQDHLLTYTLPRIQYPVMQNICQLLSGRHGAGTSQDSLHQLSTVLKRLDRGLRGVQDALALRLKMQALMLQEHLTERTT